jgi:hypothetical protein
MSESKENPVDSTADASGDAGKEDKVAYSSYRKAVDAEKKAAAKARELEKQLEEIKHKELESQNQFKSLADEFKTKAQRLEDELTKERESNAWQRVTNAVSLKAKEAGCVSPQKLLKLFDKTDFELLKAENGEIRPDSLDALITKAKKENPFMFEVGKIKINDKLPGNDAGKEKKSLDSLKKEEIEAMLLQLGKK